MSSHVASVPSLDAFFGKAPGTDRTLVDWPEMIAWFEVVERCSSRLRVESLGQTTEGGEMLLLILSSPSTIAMLDEARERRRALVDDDLLRDPMHGDGQLAGDKTVVLLTAGIHATEVGGVQLMPELIADLALSEAPEVTRLLDSVILLVIPTLNPDGMDLVHRWYRDTRGTPAEGSDPPALYHRYAGHDNNRDWYTHALEETRLAVEQVHNVWRPHLVLDLHQMRTNAPRYVVPPYIDPSEPHLHPRINALASAVGAHAHAALVREGRLGACSGVMFDCYSPTRAYQHYHGGVRILAEAASAGIASPVEISADEVKPQRGFDPNIPSVHNPAPWPGGTWHLRDIMDYHLTTIRAVLDHAATFREQWLRDQWAVLSDQVHEPAVTFVIAPLRHQIDPAAARSLVRLLRAGDVRVEVTTESAPPVAPGSFLVRSDQPFGNYARALLELTPYPVSPRVERPPTMVPYDVTTHCLPIHMGVEVSRMEGVPDVASRPVADADLEPFPPLRASDISRDRWLAIDHRSHAAGAIVIRALQNGTAVHRLRSPHLQGGRLLPAGTWLISDDSVFAAAADANARAVRSWLVRPVRGRLESFRLPRIALHLSWRPNAIDAGWLRRTLDGFDIPYDIVRDADIRHGLGHAYDVLLLPHLAPTELMEGNNPQVYPASYSGGLGRAGAEELRAFMEDGGHIVAIDGSARAIIEAMKLPIRLPLAKAKPDQFSCPGAMVRVHPDPLHELTLGMDEPLPVFFLNSTAFAPDPSADVTVAATFAERDVVVSGWAHGEQHLGGLAAIVDMPFGAGRFIGIGFRPHFRAQMLTGYNVLMNPILRAGNKATTRPVAARTDGTP